MKIFNNFLAAIILYDHLSSPLLSNHNLQLTEMKKFVPG